MKKYMIIALCVCLVMGVTACSQLGEIKESSNQELPPSSVSEESQPPEETSNTPNPNEIPLAYHADTEKYYDYFRENNYVGMLLRNETGGKGFSDAEMASYALCELIKLSDGIYDSAIGFPKEDIDAVTEKYFGAMIKNYENRMTTVISETGNITSTGWGGTSLALVLKELKTESDGIYTAVFYQFGFSMDEYQSSTKDDLLREQFDSYRQPSLITIVFEEKTDENGEMYLRYYEAKSEGEAEPPFDIYQG